MSLAKSTFLAWLPKLCISVTHPPTWQTYSTPYPTLALSLATPSVHPPRGTLRIKYINHRLGILFWGAEQHQHVALCIRFVCSFRLSKTSPNIGFYELTWYYSAPGCFHNSSSKNGSSQLCSKMVDLYPTGAGLTSEIYWWHQDQTLHIELC